ncbi:YitT family protein [Enterococcus hulanensis]|uniref:YitT family protein n=1 Tax=Enterococcus hulanensis TaxID=2559929 RepID=A0ABU3F486_9ENTE|nr:YitT family protein [Enterococcus hulanensis]MDT2601293.1 YitT family protein [Enterococcus hulanensis]MDT2610797.1 YitT family protein [Enterococcus hulanensis]MDT2618202.1 YitT family protein [Enterococcus hulanensis]MDT2629228.1 YitT family protein [Enterococcus hulanensis]MDT2656767.1 YitT family protein [Enterococcus hulanensis]
MSKNFLSRIILVFLGTVLMGIGIEIIVVADQGFDSVSTLILGLMNHSTIPFGRWSQLISIVFLLVTFFYKRSMLGVGSIINTLLVGETINRIAPTVQSIDVLQNNILASLLGFFIMALGTALYLSGELGSGPLEGMMFCICDLLHISLQKGRVLLDFIIVISGVLLGGSFGLGTAFAIFLLGPMIQADISILKNIKLKSFWSRQKKKRLTE